MEQKGLETDQHRYYIKWLRYYLDFCHKYKFKRQNKESLSAFLEKLKEKKQAESLRKQAHYAVSLFYEMGHLSGRKTRNGTSYGKSAAYECTEPDISSSHTKKVAFNQAVFSNRKTIPQTSKPGSDTNLAPRQSGADWTEVFNELKNAVKMRHYSPKTLKTYSGWVRKLQTYTKSKDPRLVSVHVCWGEWEKSSLQLWSMVSWNVFFGQISADHRARSKAFISGLQMRCR